MKSLIDTVTNLLRTRSVEPATGGRGEASLINGIERNGDFIRVHLAEKKPPTKIKSSTTSNPLYQNERAFKDGTYIHSASFAEQQDFRFSVMNATTQRQEEKMSEGKKYDNGKPAMAYLSPKGVESEAEAMGYGAAKYGPYNWRKGIAVSRYISASLRHIFAVIKGEQLDPESGLSHLGHAKANLGMAIQTLEDYPELNDLYKKEEPK